MNITFRREIVPALPGQPFDDFFENYTAEVCLPSGDILVVEETDELSNWEDFQYGCLVSILEGLLDTAGDNLTIEYYDEYDDLLDDPYEDFDEFEEDFWAGFEEDEVTRDCGC